MGAMYQAERLIQSIHFGFNTKQLFLRFDFRKDSDLTATTTGLRISFLQPEVATLDIQLFTVGGEASVGKLIKGDLSVIQMPNIRFQQILEIALPFSALNWQANQQITFFVQLHANNVDLERHPEVGTLIVTVPSETFEIENWHV